MVKIDLQERDYQKEYSKVAKFYEQYGYFQKIILVDKKGIAIEGVAIIIYAKNNNIKNINAIILENVEVTY